MGVQVTGYRVQGTGFSCGHRFEGNFAFWSKILFASFFIATGDIALLDHSGSCASDQS